MLKIGGMFCLEKNPPPSGAASSPEGRTLTDKPEGGDRRFCMSGRCAIYYCLLDLMPGDTKRTAYLPAYTCETVVAPYKKAGYRLLFYDVSPENLIPRFDQKVIPDISVLGLCGYYGFSFYDRDFVARCVKSGVTVIQDITHSVFSAGGIETMADYNAGSFRKWMGIASGGIAVKRKGKFGLPLLPAEEEHLRGRLACFAERERVVNRSGGASEERVETLFWETEMRLRSMFDAYASDSPSEEIIGNFPYEDIIRKRRNNYAAILAASPFSAGVKPVFPVLDEGVCPSHMSLYSPDRDAAQEFLARRGIGSTFYWPFHGEAGLDDFPGTRYICDHIYSVPIDQRYTNRDMDLICKALRELGEVQGA
ncbi:MAG: hypothetical protein LBI85_00845 [Spirochaetaceae bacterium]|jgi:hypothetical protein|nr:hypothetical protein [Spirochaetaceae bacterium]